MIPNRRLSACSLAPSWGGSERRCRFLHGSGCSDCLLRTLLAIGQAEDIGAFQHGSGAAHSLTDSLLSSEPHLAHAASMCRTATIYTAKILLTPAPPSQEAAAAYSQLVIQEYEDEAAAKVSEAKAAAHNAARRAAAALSSAVEATSGAALTEGSVSDFGRRGDLQRSDVRRGELRLRTHVSSDEGMEARSKNPARIEAKSNIVSLRTFVSTDGDEGRQ